MTAILEQSTTWLFHLGDDDPCDEPGIWKERFLSFLLKNPSAANAAILVCCSYLSCNDIH